MPKGSTVMQACKQAEVEIPHFCYHERLSVAGNCRMCLVEVEGAPKPVASCHWPAADGMKVRTQGEVTDNARKGVMEFLLINHPLDCPICDQGGECDLQDMAVGYGADRTHFNEMKRAVDDKEIGAKIKTVMTRCIHCTRCIRFATEIAGVEEMGATGRGENMEVGTYVESALQSELAGNMIDLCPVGALTSKPYAYTARPWELVRTDGIDVMDGLGSHISIDSRAGEVLRITPRECEVINEEWISDAARFSYDGLKEQRLTTPMIKKNGKWQSVGWPAAFTALQAAFKGVKSSDIAGLAGDIHSAEDYFAFNSFMKETLGTPHVDARGDGSLVDGTTRAAYTMGTPLAKVGEADHVLLIGCNPRLEAPLLNTRLRGAVRRGTMQVASIGSPMDLTYPHTSLPNTPLTLEKMLDGVEKYAKTFKGANKPLIIVGAGALARADGLQILHLASLLAEYFKVVTPQWNGFNVLQSTAGRVTALDMNVTPGSKGKGTTSILTAWRKGAMKALVQYGDIDQDASKLVGTGTHVYIGTHRSIQAEQADILLPAAAYTEKAGLWTNTEGRVQETLQAVQPPLQAKEDWKIFRALSEQLGTTTPLPFNTLAQLRNLIVAGHPAYGQLGVIMPTAWHPVGEAGAVKDEPFAEPVMAYYLRNEILRASPTMHACQAETTAAATAQQEAA